MGCLISKKFKLLILLGSASKKSTNAGLVHEIQHFPINQTKLIQIVVFTLDQLPIYSQEEQKKIDQIEVLSNLRKQTFQANAILFATPQINGSISPLILNSFLWLSKFYDIKKKQRLLQNKKAGLISASFLSEDHIIDCFQIGKQLNMNIYGESFHLPLGNKATNPEGKIVASAEVTRLYQWYNKFIEFAIKK